MVAWLQRRGRQLLLAKVRNASGRIGIFYVRCTDLGPICFYVQSRGWVGGSEPILTLFELRKLEIRTAVPNTV